VNHLRQFWYFARKVYDLPRRLRAVRDCRRDPKVPTWALTATLFCGALLRRGSFLQMQADTARRGWKRLIGYAHEITDDRLAYVCERYRLADLRGVLVDTNKTIKRNKGFEQAKIDGLLVVSIDANEQFKSRHRCCPDCRMRKIKVTNDQGQTQEITEFYHYQVYAQIHGPQFSVVLDLETIRPGEEEAKAAVRMLGRMRRCYGPRFFDVVSLDAWYTNGPTLRAIQKLGWEAVAVLKQERYEIYQESTSLTQDQEPLQWKWEDRAVDLWEVKDLDFTSVKGKVRVVRSHERWQQVKRKGKERYREQKESQWRWVATEGLDGCSAKTIWRIGHHRWGVENHAFNELTQYYHLEHCPHHHPEAIIAWLLILVLAFNLFELFVRVNGKLWRQGKTTLKNAASELFESLARWEEIQPLWSG
jgi:hypothetical protein